MTTDEVLALISAGRQGEWWNLLGTDWREGKCWRCRENPTTDPLETCNECREELANG